MGTSGLRMGAKLDYIKHATGGSGFVGWFVLPLNSCFTALNVLSQVNSQRNNCYIYKNKGTHCILFLDGSGALISKETN